MDENPYPESRVKSIVLDSPPANALDWQLVDFISSRIDESVAEGAQVIVFRSAGRHFCAGVDIGFIARARNDAGREIRNFGIALQALYQRIENLPAVTIALMEGHALGGGLELALACDIRIAERGASLGLPETTLGLLPGAGGTQRLTRLIGRGHASTMILTGEAITGASAAAMNLVETLPEGVTAAERCASITHRLVEIPAETLAAAKNSISIAGTPDGYASEIEHTSRLLRLPETMRRLESFTSSEQRSVSK